MSKDPSTPAALGRNAHLFKAGLRLLAAFNAIEPTTFKVPSL